MRVAARRKKRHGFASDTEEKNTPRERKSRGKSREASGEDTEGPYAGVLEQSQAELGGGSNALTAREVGNRKGGGNEKNPWLETKRGAGSQPGGNYRLSRIARSAITARRGNSHKKCFETQKKNGKYELRGMD